MRKLLLIITLLTYSLNVFAQAETPPSQLDELSQLNQEVMELYQAGQSRTGTTRDVLRMQVLNKNNELRDKIGELISEPPEGATATLLDYVKRQERYTDNTANYLSNKILADEKALDKASQEEQLLKLKQLNEERMLSVQMLGEQWENYRWMEQLGHNADQKKNKLAKAISNRLEFVSASLDYNNQQEKVLAKQLKEASEGEKASLQLMHILAQRKLSSDIDRLNYLINLGDQAQIDTSNYKKQQFEVTGDLTNDILNPRVIYSIVSAWADNLKKWLIDNTPQVLFKVLIFALVLLLFRLLKNLTRKVVKRAVASPNLKMSQLMQDFFISMSGKAVFFLGLLIALSQVGLNLAPILTGFGVAGVIIGFALQDTLSNFASGMMLLIYRPFDVGDFVEAGGVSGKVSHMSLVNTTIRTFDNQIIIVPNSKIWGDTIKNVTHERVRRVDMVFGIGYKDSIEQAEAILHDIIDNHPAVLRAPEKTIKVHTLNTSSVDFIVRPWVKTDDYWDVYWDVTREVKLRFDKEGVSIPFPQQDVHLHMVSPEKNDA
ncbi:mechanosensitive ion channel family protein [Photobacterium sp. WH77]|uniref:mechanosensitive ion channel family protein n=1 Tax=unclassified Photobacterium TaxID=2628852 RepID=UPI001EDBCDE2|nr:MULTISPECIES: mechanosensitive ion channel family protein [unclassified Photobacterium]MCG2838485.1 mechanosensitive ion channel family protein [Photobacterium sp. WH77]MCG2846143.1 mechanosensitive ion channel family protein [Photobacterium sp. WH80]MDO6580162.1 mechanosensitive ion channel family protein [Photobacterium sp. 2_MG-2023]